MRPNTTVKFSHPIIQSEINPSIGIGLTQEQRKTLTWVGFDPTTFRLDHRLSYKAREGAGRRYVRFYTQGQILLLTPTIIGKKLCNLGNPANILEMAA